jgi:hypothetical protein
MTAKRVISRRLLLVATGSLGMGLIGSVIHNDGGYRNMISSIVRLRLSYLTLEAGAADAFAKDFESDFGRPNRAGGRLSGERNLLDTMGPILRVSLSLGF